MLFGVRLYVAPPADNRRSYRRASHWRLSHEHVSHGRVPHWACISGTYTSWACTPWTCTSKDVLGAVFGGEIKAPRASPLPGGAMIIKGVAMHKGNLAAASLSLSPRVTNCTATPQPLSSVTTIRLSPSACRCISSACSYKRVSSLTRPFSQSGKWPIRGRAHWLLQRS
jgi:hypothetical protein